MAPTTMAPVFIVGVPRSGTTLLSAMLNAHPDIAVSPETFFLEWALQRSHLDLRKERDFESFWSVYSASKPFQSLGLDGAALHDLVARDKKRTFAAFFAAILRAYAEIRGKRRCGEKTPRHYLYVDTLLEWFPRATIVFLVRDPRAVAASLLRVPWASDDVEEHAWRWKQSDRIVSAYSGDDRLLTVRYEDLVTEPADELARICASIGEDFDASMLQFAASAEALVAGESHKDNVLRPLTAASIDKWKTELTGRQIATVEQITWNEMPKWGYEHLSRGLSPTDRIVVRARSLLRLLMAAGRRVAGKGSTGA